MNMTNGSGLSITGPTRRSRLTTAALLATLAAALTHLVPFALAQQPGVPPAAIRGEIVLPRAGHDWMSQQVEEPCILPNPKVPGHLVMFYSAVSSSNRVVAAIGKAWAETRDPFRWHQDDANPVFRPAERGWDSSTIRLDTVLYIPEEDAYYEWHQVFKLGATYVLCIEVGVDHGARWRPGLAVSSDPVQGWTQLDLDTVLQTTWRGLYDDRTLYHVATPALYQIEGKWYLFAQACGRPANDNYIDGAWEMWGIACDCVIPTRQGCAELHIPGVPAPTVGEKGAVQGGVRKGT